MRLGSFFNSRICLPVLAIVLTLQVTLLSVAQASSTNVFAVKDSLQGAGFTPSGIQAFKFKTSSHLLLGTNSTVSTLAIAVFEMDCTENGLRPAVRLVAYNRGLNEIVAPLVEFSETAKVYSGVNKLIYQARGIGLGGVEGADMDALITLSYIPCTAVGSPTVPTSVTIQPLGKLKPSGNPGFNAPITSDEGALVFLTDDPTNPFFEVDVTGQGTLPSQTCNVNLSSTTINFGDVVLGTNTTRTLILRNNGGIACTVQAITLNGSSAFSISSPASPFLVPAGSSVTLTAAFAPIAGGADSAVFRVTSTDPTKPQQFINVSGNGLTTAPCNITASPLLLPFGSIQLGTNKVLSVTVTNSGGTACEIDNLTLVTNTPDFEIIAPALPIPVQPGSSVVVSVRYTPSAVTNVTGTLEIDNGDTDNRLILVSLTASGILPTCIFQVGPTHLDYGSVVVGTNSDLNIVVTNNSLITCSVTSNFFGAGSTDFALAPGVVLPISLFAGQSTNITVRYTPTGGPATNTVTILTDGTPASTVVTLTGLGVGISSNCETLVSVTQLDFNDVAVGSSSVLKFKVGNASLSNCTLQSLVLVGSPDFTVIAPPLPFQLSPLTNIEIAVRYTPATAGVDSGTLQVIGEDAVINEIALLGNGVQPMIALSTNSLAFGDVPVGSNVTLIAYVTNTNTVNATIQSITKTGSGNFIFDPFVPTSRFTLAPGDTFEIPVIYLPSAAASDTGTVSIASDALGAPFTIQLTGRGLLAHLTLTPSQLAFGTAVLGSTNTLTLTVNNTGNAPASLESVEIFGNSRFFVTDPSLPLQINPGGSTQIEVDYLPINIQTILLLGGSVKTTGNPTIVNP